MLESFHYLVWGYIPILFLILDFEENMNLLTLQYYLNNFSQLNILKIKQFKKFH